MRHLTARFPCESPLVALSELNMSTPFHVARAFRVPAVRLQRPLVMCSPDDRRAPAVPGGPLCRSLGTQRAGYATEFIVVLERHFDDAAGPSALDTGLQAEETHKRLSHFVN